MLTLLGRPFSYSALTDDTVAAAASAKQNSQAPQLSGGPGQPKASYDAFQISLEIQMVIRVMLIAIAAVIMVRMIGPAHGSSYRELKERSRRNRAFRLRHPSFTA